MVRLYNACSNLKDLVANIRPQTMAHHTSIFYKRVTNHLSHAEINSGVETQYFLSMAKNRYLSS